MVKESSQINAEKLSKEEDKVVEEISYNLCKSRSEKNLLFVMDYIQTMIKFMLNQATSDELDRFYENVQVFEQTLEKQKQLTLSQ